MKGNEQVIEALNAGLTIELTAINLYFIHSKMLGNWGLNKLAGYYYKESIEEMKHADEVIDRILFMDGVPAISRYDVINVGSSPQEMIENGMALEIGTLWRVEIGTVQVTMADSQHCQPLRLSN